ncbi:MAG TPA: TonB-dependent receptor [Thermoanaerobaculia bacterium]
MRVERRRLGVALFMFALPAVHLAQTTGEIDGRVLDSAGVPLSGVKVEAKGPSLPGVRTSITDRDGIYRLPGVPPGAYHVTASLPEFRPVKKTCTVTLGSTATVDLTLRLETEAKLVVSGEAPPIDTTSTRTGTSYTSAVIGKLPVDRNYADIVRANPGVSTDQGFTDGRMLPLTIYGATSSENQWVIDGVNTTSVQKGIQGKALSSELIGEVQVQTGGYQAEYGRALGGIINAVTKSGGNAFHGDGYVYYDSAATQAQRKIHVEDLTLVAMQTDDANRFDYGASLGGYLLKDRLWFFGAYNRVTLDTHVSRLESSALVSKDLQFPFSSTDNLYSGKLTWNAAPSTTVVASVFADPSTTAGASGGDPRRDLAFIIVFPPVSPAPSTWNSTRSQGGDDYGVQASQLFGTDVLATLQGSDHQDRSSLTAADEIQYKDFTCTGGTPDAPCGAPRQPNSITGGYGFITAADNSESSRAQIAAAVSVFARAHDLKAGGDYMYGRSDGTTSYTGEQQVGVRNEYGQTYYRHNFFAVSPTDPTPVPAYHGRAQVYDYSAYAQDFWRLAPGLTVNLGVRWDGERTHDYSGRTVFETSLWQPRIGVAWDPWRDGATKVYAFAGRFSYAMPTQTALSLFLNSYTRIATINFDPVSVAQDPTVLNHGKPEVSAVGAFGVPADANLKGASQDELLVGLERMLAPGLTVGIKGTYRSLNDAIGVRYDLDYKSPLTDFSSYAIFNPGSSGKFASGNVPTCNGLADPYYQCSPTGSATPPARRIYRGIELLARETLGDRLWLQASYVYSSLRGNTEDGVSIGGDYSYPQLWYNGYGSLSRDRPHHFRLDGSWVTPWKVSIGLQTFVESGAPYDKLGYFNGNIGVHLVPRGSAGRLPTLWDANLLLAYPVNVGPVTLTFQAYVYNLFNNQIATSVDEVWSYDQPAGYPASIYDPNQKQGNPTYGQVTWRYSPRSLRAGLRVSF